ncbi:hypothetical protein [Flagellimonas sp.]|uniref:hypothetical protein n=1 Tax=Flagellimonas sp. TaxID=2058762 RepID=UPI003BB1A0EE
MIVSDIGIVTVITILLFGLPILWSAKKKGLWSSFSFVGLLKLLNISLLIQVIVGLILILVTWLWNLSEFEIPSLLGGTTYTYLVIGLMIYLPTLVVLNLLNLLFKNISNKKQ